MFKNIYDDENLLGGVCSIILFYVGDSKIDIL
jgi:hypothetical protein